MECFVAYPSIYDSYIYSKIRMLKIYCINRRCCFHRDQMIGTNLQTSNCQSFFANVSFGVALFWLESFLFESPPNNDCCRVFVWKESNLCYSRCNSSIIEGHFSTFGETKWHWIYFNPILCFFFHVPKELPFNIYWKKHPPKGKTPHFLKTSHSKFVYFIWHPRSLWFQEIFSMRFRCPGTFFCVDWWEGYRWRSRTGFGGWF